MGAYPKYFGLLRANLEDFLDVKVIIWNGRNNRVDKMKTLGMHRCNPDDIKFFNTPSDEFSVNFQPTKIDHCESTKIPVFRIKATLKLIST